MPRDGEVVSRQAHNLKIVGANPTPATKMKYPFFEGDIF